MPPVAMSHDIASPSQDTSIGFVGLGAMGFGMATNLVKKGFQVKGFDAYPPSIERFKAAGGIPASSLAESAAGNMYYVCMVATAVQAQSALFDEHGIVDALPRGATLLLCSTVPSSYAQSVPKKLETIGRGDIFFIDCPVSGGAKRAADGTLSIMAGATPTAISKGQFILSTMADSKKLYIVPGGVGGGSNLKMVHQVLAGIHILAASEAMGLAARMQLDAKQVVEAVIGSGAWSWMYENRVPRMLEEDYFPGVSALTIILKDVGIITATARLHTFPTPLSSTAEQVYISGLSRGFGANDDAGMVRMYHPDPIAKSCPSSIATASEVASSIDVIVKLLEGIHACAAAEAIAFTQHLGLDLDQMYDLVNDAAGGSRAFRDSGIAMIHLLKGETTKQAEKMTIAEHLKNLSTAVSEGRRLECPMYLASEALNLCSFAKQGGWDGLPDSNLVRIWER